MALININNSKVISKSIPGIKSVNYQYSGKKITAISPVDKILSVFTSSQIIADEGFIRWLDVVWSGVQNDFDLGIFVRSSESNLSDEKWFGPYYNNSFDIGIQRGQYLQFMVLLISDGITFPSLNSLSIRYITSSSSTKFYTKAFDLNFKPENILLTYNAHLTNDTIINFFVSGDDSVDPLDYQQIEPNKIQDLNNLSLSSDKIKLLMELSGEFNVDVAVDEFSFIIGGSDFRKINKLEMLSSSSTNSSESSSSSSSSLDSSSSSSSSSSSDSSSSSSS